MAPETQRSQWGHRRYGSPRCPTWQGPDTSHPSSQPSRQSYVRWSQQQRRGACLLQHLVLRPHPQRV
eukprot:scaffold76062_cov36-Phaeocystis_antarctica.AAC.2